MSEQEGGARQAKPSGPPIVGHTACIGCGIPTPLYKNVTPTLRCPKCRERRKNAKKRGRRR